MQAANETSMTGRFTLMTDSAGIASFGRIASSPLTPQAPTRMPAPPPSAAKGMHSTRTWRTRLVRLAPSEERMANSR
jgi:hypothetical protein